MMFVRKLVSAFTRWKARATSKSCKHEQSQIDIIVERLPRNQRITQS
jgi:hypothetical protein